MVTITKCDFCDKEIHGEPYGNPSSEFPCLFELCKECSMKKQEEVDFEVSIKLWFEREIPMKRKITYV